MKKLTVDEAKKHPFYHSFRRFNVPIGFLGAEFSDYDPNWIKKGEHANDNYAAYLKYVDYIDNIEAKINEGKGIFISGSFGIGKTMLMTIAFKKAITYFQTRTPNSKDLNPSHTLGWLTGSYLVELFCYRTERNDERREKLPTIDFLAIDELAKIPLTASNKEKIFIEDILRTRAFEMRPTIITSQGNVEDVGRDISRAIPELIQEYYDVVHIVGKSYRGNY